MYMCSVFFSGNWDLKTKVPQQCKVSRIKLPGYFMEWINLKDVYLNFYHREVSSCLTSHTWLLRFGTRRIYLVDLLELCSMNIPVVKKQSDSCYMIEVLVRNITLRDQTAPFSFFFGGASFCLLLDTLLMLLWQARGMMAMMKQLDISVLGSHHLGLDDTKNIARVLQRMLVNGAVMRITAWRSPKSPYRIQFAYQNRI